jgi:hypothetical protein
VVVVVVGDVVVVVVGDVVVVVVDSPPTVHPLTVRTELPVPSVAVADSSSAPTGVSTTKWTEPSPS